MTEYCVWSSNCVALGCREVSCEVDLHRCCQSCKDKSCTCRCTADVHTCKYTMLEDEFIKMLENKHNPFFKTQPANNKAADQKTAQVQIPKQNVAAKQQPSCAVEAKEIKPLVIPHNVAELARLLGVSYDKVNYRVGWKHMTYEETYEALRKK